MERKCNDCVYRRRVKANISEETYKGLIKSTLFLDYCLRKEKLINVKESYICKEYERVINEYNKS